MPSNTSNNGNKKDSADDLTIKDVSSKLDISEATVKKYIKDFGLAIEKGLGNKAVIAEETFQALTEIVKLRANGLSIQEIKELKTQKPSKNILDEIEETAVSLKPNDVESVDVKSVETAGSDLDASSLAENEAGNGSLSQDEKLDEDDESDVLEDKTSEEEGEGEEQERGQERRKRRGFNYRYVERQIANDSKRVYSLRQRVKNPNISVKDRLFFEEALERRILFLNGWKHILRWMSK